MNRQPIKQEASKPEVVDLEAERKAMLEAAAEGAELLEKGKVFDAEKASDDFLTAVLAGESP